MKNRYMNKHSVIKEVIKIADKNTVKDLASQMKLKIDKIKRVLKQSGIEKEYLNQEEAEYLLEMMQYKFIVHQTMKEKIINRSNEVTRPPIIGIVGHVDHGKTSLLDKIRKSNLASAEHGGITQHINSYSIEWNNKRMTFIDTPGHEAFIHMRKRGVQITDIVLLVVSAVDGINKQTIESINHIKLNKTTFIVVINKCDLPSADPNKVEQDLLQYDILVESLGGQVLSVHCSAKTGQNIDRLLDTILLQADMMNITAPDTGNANGIVLESFLDKHKGVIIHGLIMSGCLQTRDCCVIGNQISKIRLITNDSGQVLSSATPAIPIEIWGFSKTPNPGDEIFVVKNEIEGRILIKEETKKIENETLSTFNDNAKILNLIIKCDAYGSVEAFRYSIPEHDLIHVNITLAHVGPITPGDLELAKLTGAIILNFNNIIPSNIQRQAESYNVKIYNSKIIYDLLNNIKDEITDMIDPEIIDTTIGEANLIKIFQFKAGVVLGCIVKSGAFAKGNKIKVLNAEEKEIFNGKISNIQKERENISIAREGVECGIAIGSLDNEKKLLSSNNLKKIIAYEREIK